jgi:hypothetical protein
MKRTAILFFILAATTTSCHGKVVSLAEYPSPGFGRVGCFARIPERTQWLVLDSILENAGGAQAPTYRRNATVILDSLKRIGGIWYPAPGDSVIISERSIMPGKEWRLARRPDGLEGETVLVHDIVESGRNRVSRGRVRMQRISCSEVPLVQW